MRTTERSRCGECLDLPTPHPQSLSPLRGEGSQCRTQSARIGAARVRTKFSFRAVLWAPARSLAIARAFQRRLAIGRFGYAAGNLDIATGESFPDALAGGAHAGRNRVPMVLTPNATPSGATNDQVCAFLLRQPVTGGTILGGRSAVKSGTKYHMEECVQAG